MTMIYLTRPVDAACGAFQLPSSFSKAYEELLKGGEVTLSPVDLQYNVNRSIQHFRTAHFNADRLYKPYAEQITNAAMTRLATLQVEAEQLGDVDKHYSQFKIPKRSGGYRTIDAPSEELKSIQQRIAHTLTYGLFMYPHDSAHAYIKGRSPKTSLEIHQANKSKWFLKLDIKDFFPSCTEEFVIPQLQQLHPLEYANTATLWLGLRPAFLRGALPQGAVTSPLLSNLVMIPFDHKINKVSGTLHQHFVYTRYADDILISSEFDFNFHEVEAFVSECFQGSPLVIKKEKTRYGSAAGQNWNLGLMLNKDNAITVGSQRKVEFKHAVFNLMTDYKKGLAWAPEDKLHLRGVYSYIYSVEPAYAQGVINFYEQKLGVSWEHAIKIS